ncbi:SDR family NAD(P)-dependent oxidoreductase [Acidocella aminolytica]|uniref:Oxidoreductase/SDR, 3-oxoacyl-(Acyl carrier protein) reductase n=1 Tax=Acidocella aminolytica 101 = DSM 11237 TaxID=1120923 RepID=A0A0D6PF09_9PROT|nr:SDR family oxidoreductase [Acidocella aminolytica]GAN80335.1 oxidoreductase/SDR, 3-oxoacyl-(acyl carrier protein) reductase [Acidocella aminolytica 101 = DSM 11237]GBQ42984.1 dehydrogenase [Acidocella aminolytica 101 = DSM 11237]SHE29995.1 3-oxoacyl-[acyl-carrier protein] reductase [Acidocella aminolytica 101 = DSM 11237]
MKRLEGRVALVTGAARTGSIGRAIAWELAQEGACIAVADYRREDEARGFAEEIEEAGGKSSNFDADVTSPAACEALVARVAARFGRLDILVNNAGHSRHQKLEDITEADFDEMIGLHLRGPFFLARAAAVHMRAAGWGRIVNISSEQSYGGDPELPHYTAAKAGLRTMTKSLALALAPCIAVNTVAPGPTATDRFKNGPEYLDEFRERIPLKRWGAPRDVARSVLFLVTDDGDAYTGQTLDPNCGTVMP